MRNAGQHKTDSQDTVLEDVISTGAFDLILYNDDVNTFEHVINCLVKYCRHEPLQAEQCAFIVHTTGKCSVKRGHYTDLEPICTALCDMGLSAQIEARD